MVFAIPLLLLVAGFVLAFAIILVLLACILAATGSALAFLGAVSISTLIGCWKRKPSIAIKAFILQLLGLIGALDGFLVVFLASFASTDSPGVDTLLAGASAGMLLGLLIGLLLIRLGRRFKGSLALRIS